MLHLAMSQAAAAGKSRLDRRGDTALKMGGRYLDTARCYWRLTLLLWSAITCRR